MDPYVSKALRKSSVFRKVQDTRSFSHGNLSANVGSYGDEQWHPPAGPTWPGPNCATSKAAMRSGSYRSARPSSTGRTCRPRPTRSSPNRSARPRACAPVPVLPAIPVGCSYGHGTEMPGTLSLTPELLAARRAAVGRVGGDFGAAPLAVRERALRQRGFALDRDRSPPAVPARPARGATSTGGRSTPPSRPSRCSTAKTCTRTARETSVMLVLAPELVHDDRLDGADDPDRTADLVFRYTAPVALDQRRDRSTVGSDDRARREAARPHRRRARRSHRARPLRRTSARRRLPPATIPCQPPTNG